MLDKVTEMRIRGLKVSDFDETTKLLFAEAEFLCSSEQGLLNLCGFLQKIIPKWNLSFTKLHIAGDKHEKIGIKI